jgi:hypothetical protein
MLICLAERLEVHLAQRWQTLPHGCRWFVGCVGSAVILGLAAGLLAG